MGSRINVPFLVTSILLVVVIIVVLVFGIQLSGKITANSNSISDLQTQDTSFKSSLTNFNSQVSTLSGQLTQANTQLTQANNQLTTLNTQVAADSAQITTLKSQLSAASADLSALKTQLTASTAKITSLETQVTALNTKATSLQNQIDKLDTGSSGTYTTLVSSKDFLSTAFTFKDPDYYVLLKSFTADSTNDGYLYITGSIDSSTYENDVYVVVIKTGDIHSTISSVITYQEGLSNPWNNYTSIADYNDDEIIYADDGTVKVYLVNTSGVEVDANNVTVRYYLD
jgi:uncharacterized phage infection (PIP) family protein YhgE